MSRTLPPRANILGTAISTTSHEEVLEWIRERPSDAALAIVVCNVHSVMSARRDPALRQAIAEADIATPDGMPLVWALRASGWNGQERVYGPELMKRCVLVGRDWGFKHYLYGTTDETLARLESALKTLAPGVDVVGSWAPPFRPLSDSEVAADAERIRESDPDVVWVGLGMPKQEMWIARAAPLLPGRALVGVGAAFDILAGNVSQAPPALQRLGLEWAYRLAQEPRRLWRRYVFNNPAYLVLLAGQLLRQSLTRVGHRQAGSRGL